MGTLPRVLADLERTNGGHWEMRVIYTSQDQAFYYTNEEYKSKQKYVQPLHSWPIPSPSFVIAGIET